MTDFRPPMHELPSVQETKPTEAPSEPFAFASDQAQDTLITPGGSALDAQQPERISAKEELPLPSDVPAADEALSFARPTMVRPPFTKPEPMVQYDVPSGTIGSELVRHTNYKLQNTLEAAVAEDRMAYAEQLKETKVHPQEGRLKHALATIAGKAMTQDEVAIIDKAARHGKEYIDWRHEQAADNNEWASSELSNIRGNFGHLDEDQTVRVESYLNGTAAPFFKNISEEYRGQGHAWAEWLTNGADDAQLVNFLQWNVDHVSELQSDPAFSEAVTEQRVAFKNAVPKGVADGHFSPLALENMSQVDEAEVYVGDPLHAIITNVRGSNLSDSTTVTPPTDGRSMEAEIKEVLPHEFCHNSLQTQNAGYGPLGERWILEGLTAEAAIVVRGKPVPTEYPYERALYATAMQGGSNELDKRLGTRAYTGTDQERQLFMHSLDESWGVPDALPKINAYVRAREKALAGRGMITNDHREEAVYDAIRALRQNPALIFGEEGHTPGVAAST